MNQLTIVLFVIVGLVLVYSAIKDKNPVDMIKQALSKNT
jgi:hypothetical protein